MGLLDKFKKKESSKGEELKFSQKKEAKVVVEKKSKIIENKTEVKATTKKSGTKLSGNAYKILVSPVVSEKSAVGESMNTYTFKVAVNATKVDVKNAIKQIYGVNPKTVRVINMEGKKTRAGRRQGRRQDWKKAMIVLSKGQSINIHEGV